MDFTRSLKYILKYVVKVAFVEYDGSKVEKYSSKNAFAEGETTNTKAHINSPHTTK